MDHEALTKNLSLPSKYPQLLLLVVAAALVLGSITGYTLAAKKPNSGGSVSSLVANQQPKTAQQDNQTFRDFAEGTIQPKQNSDSYSEGTHVLIRDGAAPVALTSSVVDLSKYEGKKVKVYGETQKALKEGWLMDVGKVEEVK